MQKFYYRWGNEEKGCVTTWELSNDECKNFQEEPYEVIEKENLQYYCPWS